MTLFKPYRVNRERGASSVIGIVLMVVITVTLASVLGVYALEFGDSGRQPGPNAAMTFTDVKDDYNTSASSPQDMFLIEFKAGDELELRTLQLTVRNVSSNEFLLTWDGRTGFDDAKSQGIIGDWNITLNENNITAGASPDTIMSGGDMIIISADNATNINGDSPGQDYKFVLIHKETSSTVAQSTVRLT